MKSLPQRKSIRLKNYDYKSSGYYFITICIQDRNCLFGKINNGKIMLNDAGIMVRNVWQSLPNRYSVGLDEFQIMPNHVHFIIQIVGAGFMPARNERANARNKRATTRVAPTTALGDVVGGFKSLTTHGYVNGVKNKKWIPFDKRLWQRNYYENIIRNNHDLNKIRKYIINNPKICHRERIIQE